MRTETCQITSRWRHGPWRSPKRVKTRLKRQRVPGYFFFLPFFIYLLTNFSTVCVTATNRTPTRRRLCKDTKRGSRHVSSPTLLPLSLSLFDTPKPGHNTRKKARDASWRVSSFPFLLPAGYHHHINERERERGRTGIGMGTRKHGDESTKGAQTTKQSFVVCSLDSRRVSSPVCFIFTVDIKFTNVYLQIYSTNEPQHTRASTDIRTWARAWGSRCVFFFFLLYYALLTNIYNRLPVYGHYHHHYIPRQQHRHERRSQKARDASKASRVFLYTISRRVRLPPPLQRSGMGSRTGTQVPGSRRTWRVLSSVVCYFIFSFFLVNKIFIQVFFYSYHNHHYQKGLNDVYNYTSFRP